MKEVRVEVPDEMAHLMEQLVQTGWFVSEGEIGRLALVEFLRRRRFELAEQFQREDIAWALRQRRATS